MGSGYTHCACGDCFDVTVSADMSEPELCAACDEAGCEPSAPGDATECQRPDAYGADEEG